MLKFSFLGDPNLYYSGRPGPGPGSEESKIRLNLSPTRLSWGLAELGNIKSENDLPLLLKSKKQNINLESSCFPQSQQR